MSMMHKAYIFDYSEFELELKPIIIDSLTSDSCNRLINFIDTNLGRIKDPYEGELVDSSWDALIELGDLDEYADFCLTKYYNPKEDLGLGENWLQLQHEIKSMHDGAECALLGDPICVEERCFDPGKMGAYFMSLDVASQNLSLLLKLHSDSLMALNGLASFVKLLDEAISLQKGLYITF